jgi:hypothetical protein
MFLVRAVLSRLGRLFQEDENKEKEVAIELQARREFA